MSSMVIKEFYVTFYDLYEIILFTAYYQSYIKVHTFLYFDIKLLRSWIENHFEYKAYYCIHSNWSSFSISDDETVIIRTEIKFDLSINRTFFSQKSAEIRVEIETKVNGVYV